MTPIKLYQIGELSDGTKRFCSQLLIGKDVADFILTKEGVMKCYGRGKNGFDFYEYNNPYLIIPCLSEMKQQQL